MDTGVIIALILGAANVLSAIFFGWIPAKNRDKVAKLEKRCDRLSEYVSFFIEEEDYLLNRLSGWEGKPQKSLKIEVRKEVADTTGKRLNENFKPSDYK